MRFTVHSKGINLNPAKAQTIRSMEPPKTTKQLKNFLRRASYIKRFILALLELLEPFQRLLKEDVTFLWAEEQQIAFQKVKNLDHPTMVSPVKWLLLTLYLASTNKSIGPITTRS